MKAKDVMTKSIVSIAQDAPILQAVGLMLRHKISGLPVLDSAGHLVGILTEGDLLRRVEIGTQRRRPRWIEFFMPGRLADEYVHASGRRVEEVMSVDVQTVDEDTSLEEIVSLLERNRIKRVPVVRGNELVGMVTRANLIRVLISAAKAAPKLSATDAGIHERLLAELKKQPWAPAGGIDIEVNDGVVRLSGIVTDDRQRQALCVAAENTPGVKRVEDEIAWVVPEAALVIGPADRASSFRG
jgi:CBS domain-containing protein